MVGAKNELFPSAGQDMFGADSFIAEWVIGNFSDLKNAFELQVRDHPSLVLVCKSEADKNNWMAALVLLRTRRYSRVMPPIGPQK